MVYCRSIVSHSLFVDTMEVHVVARRIRNCNEVRRISYRIWHRNGIGLVLVFYAKDSIIKNNEGK
jgi:hypothetical protein